jgi:hypothetical protein
MLKPVIDQADENRWSAGLESKGYFKVLVLLEKAGVPAGGADVDIPGVVSEPPYPPRSFVEAWLDQADHHSKPSKAVWRLIAIVVATAGVVGAIIASWPR